MLEGEGAAEPALEVAAGDGVSYTVPQHIRPGRVEQGCDLFFRVSRVCGASRIAVTGGGRRLAAYRRDSLAPGEMEHIVIPRKLLEQAAGPITIAVEEAEAG